MSGNEEKKKATKKNELKCKEMMGDENKNIKNIINNYKKDEDYCYL